MAGRSNETGGGYGTKVCPRCGAELYEDMNICYECLYDFSRDRARRGGDAPDPEGEDAAHRGDTLDLSGASAPAKSGAGEPGMLVRTASADLWVGVPADGLSVGRAQDNDVVLHSRAISGHHLRVVPTPDGMEVCDLGSTNPARYRGREVRGRVIVSYGDTIDVCGCALTMTGPASLH